MSIPVQRHSINVAILAFETFATMPITGPMDILNKASALWRGIYGVELPYAPFNIQLVALSDEPLQFGGHITLRPHATIATAREPALILIPSAGEKVLENLESLRPFVPWIKLWASKGARVVSLCTGAFLLAETGLLDGRSATTHWLLAGLFRKTYPQIRVHPERLIVDEGSVITSGVATSFLDLMLYIIELYNGREAAVLVSKAFQIEMGRRTQLPYAKFATCKMHNDRQILRVQELMEMDLGRELTTEAMAHFADMSVRNFDRRFHNAVGESPFNYLRKRRVEKAKELLENTNETIHEIMVSVGYEDDRSFRRLFKCLTDLSPKEYRLKCGFRTDVPGLSFPSRSRPKNRLATRTTTSEPFALR